MLYTVGVRQSWRERRARSADPEGAHHGHASRYTHTDIFIIYVDSLLMLYIIYQVYALRSSPFYM